MGEDNLPLGDVDPNNHNIDQLSHKLKILRTKFEDEFEYDPGMFYQFTSDMMRVDAGLIIQRPPIFMHMRENDKNFMVQRESIMEEFHCDTK